MNWDSFVPDLIVGLVTGGIVGAVVLGAERRFTSLARKHEVMSAQSRVVERARSVLRHSIDFHDESGDRRPNRKLLDRLVEEYASVPRGEAPEYVWTFRWAERFVSALDTLESTADALDVRIQFHFDADADHGLAIVEAIDRNVLRLISEGTPLDPEWEWQWPAGLSAAWPERDEQLRRLVEEYVESRWLLLAYREAFFVAETAWRKEYWRARRAATRGHPRTPLVRWWREIIRRRSVRAAGTTADAEARDVVDRVDPLAE